MTMLKGGRVTARVTFLALFRQAASCVRPRALSAHGTWSSPESHARCADSAHCRGLAWSGSRVRAGTRVLRGWRGWIGLPWGC